jgi:hypothetical protein
MVFLTAKLLKDIVNREIHPIRCAATCGRKAQKGLLLSDLCTEAHHPMWALKILYFVLDTIHNKDYDDWVEEYLNPEWVKLKDVISNVSSKRGKGNCHQKRRTSSTTGRTSTLPYRTCTSS